LKLSVERILTTHVGSLPRSEAVTDLIFARERGESPSPNAEAVIAEGVLRAVQKQERAGIDVVSDGEMSKISYATYVKDRLTGFAGDSPRNAPSDLEAFPGFLKRLAASGGTPNFRRPRCTDAVRTKTLAPMRQDIAHLRSALSQAKVSEAFMNAASPGVIALFQPNDFYPSHNAYLEALAEAMRPEYEAIIEAGLLLQVDSPDLGLGGHTLFKGRPTAEYSSLAAQHIEALNHALRNCPADRVRMHVCWGNYEGPHHHDVPMEIMLPIALRAKPQALLFESANPRHAHEWRVFREAQIPEDKILIPGVIDSVTNFIEHPELVAERIERFAQIVGRERVLAGTDCGFGTFAGFGAVDPEIAYAKLATLAEGARLASQRLWGGAR
jgi:5-methyltetrahydropteroyltriglutamate--homocysteine methyltransferase